MRVSSILAATWGCQWVEGTLTAVMTYIVSLLGDDDKLLRGVGGELLLGEFFQEAEFLSADLRTTLS